MNVIALSCSPSRGRNSDSMLDHFIDGVREVADMNVTKIYLDDILIREYTFENSTGPLPDEIAFKALTDRLKNETTGLVIATPTYNFSVPSHLKNFIDRIRFIALDLSKKNRLGQPVGMLGHLKMYFLVSGGTPTWAQRCLFFAFPPFWLRGVFLYFGASVLGGYYSGDVRTFANHTVLERCRREGKRYAMRLVRGKGNHLLERIFWRPPQVQAEPLLQTQKDA